MCCPRKDSLPSDRQKNRHTQHGKVWREKTSASRVLAALASSPATKALDPDPFPRHSLRHAVYAALLHFGFETAFTISSRLSLSNGLAVHPPSFIQNSGLTQNPRVP